MATSKNPASLEELVQDLRKLPGVGTKTATRYAYWLVGQDQEYLTQLAKRIHGIKKLIKICTICGNKSESEICPICQKSERKNGQICIVEHAEDILQLEKSGAFGGRYHVLGGVIDPLKHTLLEDLNTETLTDRINQESITEIILALSPTIQGDTTVQSLRKALPNTVQITTLGRGLSSGATIEYADVDTLKAAFSNRN